MATNRADAFALAYIPETTYGTDPGIVGAAWVDGDSEDFAWIPQAAGTPYKAYARLASKPDGMPKRMMVEATQIFTVSDADAYHGKGPASTDQEVSFEFLIHGGARDGAAASDTDRPIPPPWQQLITSASGRTIGHRTGDPGGGNGPTNASRIKATTAPSANDFEIEIKAGTIGALAAGHVFAVDHGTGAAARDIELVRPTYMATSAKFGDDTPALNGAEYNSVAVGFKQAPVSQDDVFFSSQTVFDRRLESSGAFTAAEAQLSFTLLIYRGDSASSCLLKGARVKSFEITEQFNEFAKCKVSFIFKTFHYYGDDSTQFTGEPTLPDEPAYYNSAWPCPVVSTYNNITLVKYIDANNDGSYSSPSVVRDLAITGLSLSWNAGWTQRHSLVAQHSVEDLRLTEKQKLTVKFTVLYDDDFRVMLGLCRLNDGANAYNSFPLIYWSGERLQNIWFFSIPGSFVIEDPGTDGEFEGNQAHEITLGWRPFNDDRVEGTQATAATYATTTAAQNRFAIGTLGGT